MQNKAIAFVLSLLICTSAFSQKVFQYFVVPVTGITGISKGLDGTTTKTSNTKYSGMISEKYADIFFDNLARSEIERQFTVGVVGAFPTSVVGPNQIVKDGASGGGYQYQPYDSFACKPQFTVDYKDTYLISIGISRLSVYFNDYKSNIGLMSQVIVPITYTVRFLKFDGAQIIFSKSETITTVLPDRLSTELYADQASLDPNLPPDSKVIKPIYIQMLKKAILNDSGTIVKALINYASQNFNPKISEVAVAYKDNEFVVFDKGSEIGFISGQQFYDENSPAQFFVRYATDGLAVAQASGGPESTKSVNKLRVGDKVSFAFDSQGVDDGKPSVLSVQYTQEPLTKEQIIANSLQMIMVDNIGFKTPFNILKVDPDFDRLKLQITSSINCNAQMYEKMHGFSDVGTTKRTDPDLFLKLEYRHSPDFTTVAETGVTTTNRFQSGVLLSLIDKDNEVRQNFSSTRLYENQRTDGKGLSTVQAQEVNLKNTVFAASKAMVEGFKLPQKVISMTSFANGKATLSEAIPATAYDQLHLVRPINIGKKTVYVPIPQNDAKLENNTQDSNVFNVVVDQIGDKLNKLRASDLVLVKGGFNSGRAMRLCDPVRKRVYLPEGLKYGSLNELSFAQSVAVASGKFRFLQPSVSFTQSMSNALNKGFFETRQITPNTENALCVLPIEFVELKKLDCPANTCSGSVDITLGLRVYEGEKKIAEVADARNINFNEVNKLDVSGFVGFKIFELQNQLYSSMLSKF